MLLASEELIDCSYDDFLKHFIGKKIYSNSENITKIKWYGGGDILTSMLKYLAEKGFVSFTDMKIYNFIIIGISLNDIVREHFKIAEVRKINKKSFAEKLRNLFPETTSYRCKTRLYYKARNKQSISSVLESCGVV
jgi:hypothetical protein